MDIFELAAHNQQYAQKLLETTGIIQAWENIGATVQLVGSLKSGLMMKNLDIDLHIYTEKINVADSFAVMQQLAATLPLREIQYRNLIDTEEECIEWHTIHEGEKNCKFDMIHIRKDSKYDGTVERVTDAIIKRLSPDIRRTILQIKYDIPDGVMIPGIEIYHAVLTGNIKSYEALKKWRQTNPLTNSLDWLP